MQKLDSTTHTHVNHQTSHDTVLGSTHHPPTQTHTYILCVCVYIQLAFTASVYLKTDSQRRIQRLSLSFFSQISSFHTHTQPAFSYSFRLQNPSPQIEIFSGFTQRRRISRPHWVGIGFLYSKARNFIWRSNG